MGQVESSVGGAAHGRPRALLAIAALSAVAVAVAFTNADAQQSGPPAGGADGGGADGGGADGGGADAGSAAVRVTDADILDILRAINEGEVQQATPAQDRGVASSVREFAAQMITEHSDALERLNALAQSAGVQPTPNGISLCLRGNARQVLAVLQERTPQAFDASYIDSQIVQHAAALDLIQNTLLPQAQQAAVRDELQREQAAVQQHLDRARAIANELGIAQPATDGGTPDAGTPGGGAADAGTP